VRIRRPAKGASGQSNGIITQTNRDTGTVAKPADGFAREHLPSVHPGFDQLEGDAAAKRFFLLGQPDLTHAAFSDFLQQVIAAQHMADERLVDCSGGDGLYRGLLQETAEPFFMGQQRFDLGPQGLVFPTGPAHKLEPLGVIQPQSGVVDLFQLGSIPPPINGRALHRSAEETNGEPEPPGSTFAPKRQQPGRRCSGLAMRKKPLLWPFFVLFVGLLTGLTAFRNEYLAPQIHLQNRHLVNAAHESR
jgi:hypothetical protein